MEKKGIKKMVTVAAASAAVGAGLGIMFAPKKGSDTRKDIMKALNKVTDKVKNFSKEDVKKDFEKKIKSIEKRLESLNNEKEVKKVSCNNLLQEMFFVFLHFTLINKNIVI